MEARSLADLNHLASNPPQYPVNPTAEVHEPLTLYISRVPGTRDVILSPFKPSLKNVTGEDVASSLYYVHFELPSADPALASPPRIHDESSSRSSEDSASTMTIRRKPLPKDARPITPESMRSAASTRLQPPEPRQTTELRTRPRSATTGTDVSFTTPTHLMPPPAYEYHLRTHSALHLSDPSDPAPPLPPRPPRLPPRPDLSPRDRAFDRRSPTSPTSPKKQGHTTTPFALALIRRDPSSGNQWNVGRISSHQIDTQDGEAHHLLPAQPATRLYSNPRPPSIGIRIDNSGYAKFRNMPARQSIDMRPPSSCSAIQMPRHEDISRPEDGMFSRQVVMGYQKSFTSNLKHKLRMRHGRNKSVPNIETTAQSLAPENSYGEGMKPRGYVFTSPWDGVCEFRTGKGGRSLRCVHILGDTGGGYNPLVATNEEGDSPESQASVISELRFNLPNSEIFTSERSTGQRGHFSKFFRQDGGSDESYEDGDNDAVSPFDVNVGKERAGGGNRGTRAKLGKLIIYNDGLKMLDLVVAANIGVWWGAWERSF
ncbi:hypothetical protein S40288_05188 [Stachybotrys chartarum IBT 40288]|nr:hypothetical protein S40288_05188 [Stachybotrys chartarum IBT 40288]